MSQGEILKILEKYKKPMSRQEISEHLREDSIKVSHLIKTLLIHNEIKCVEIDRLEAKEIYGDKAPCRRMRLYYL